MPIYAYKCSSCGHTKDELQKINAAALTVCPACGKATFAKQLTAPGFQLKGSGWYVTDFRDGKKPAVDAKTDDAKPEVKADTKTDAKPDTAPVATTPAATPNVSATPALKPAAPAAPAANVPAK